jgi:hypothetical protein
VLQQLTGSARVIGSLQSDSELRVKEGLRLPAKDLYSSHRAVVVRNSRDDKGRVVTLAGDLVVPLQRYLFDHSAVQKAATPRASIHKPASFHALPVLPDALPRERCGYPHAAGATGTRGCADDPDLHPRDSESGMTVQSPLRATFGLKAQTAPVNPSRRKPPEGDSAPAPGRDMSWRSASCAHGPSSSVSPLGNHDWLGVGMQGSPSQPPRARGRNDARLFPHPLHGQPAPHAGKGRVRGRPGMASVRRPRYPAR